MPVLKLSDQLDLMKSSEVRRDFMSIARFLRHRSPVVRGAAVSALKRAKIGTVELTRTIETERNELVLTNLTEALAVLKARSSLPRLRRLAESHPSQLVRKYAVHAIAKIQGKEAIRFLTRRRKVERSRRVQAKLSMILFELGVDEALPDLLRRLTSRDYLVRCSSVNMLSDARPKRQRTTIVRALQRSLENETTVAARSSLKHAVAELSSPALR
jgi:HEAT repeat protein